MTVHESVGSDADSETGSPGGRTEGRAADPHRGGGNSVDLLEMQSAQQVDLVVRSVTVAAGGVIVGLIALIGIVLVAQATPSLMANEINFLTSSEWNTSDPDSLRFGILDMLKVSVLSSLFALVLAVPVAIGIATYLVQYAPARLSRRSRRSSTCWPRSPRSSTACGGCWSWARGWCPSPNGSIGTSAGCSCSATATSRSAAAARSSPPAWCWPS